jgi:hypothetical protein
MTNPRTASVDPSKVRKTVGVICRMSDVTVPPVAAPSKAAIAVVPDFWLPKIRTGEGPMVPTRLRVFTIQRLSRHE